MPNLSNIRNSGVFVAGDKNKVTVGKQSGGRTEAELLEEINELLAELIRGMRQLPAGQRGPARAEAVELQGELEAPSRDKAKIGSRLGKLMSALSLTAPLVDIVKNIADLVAALPR